MANESFDADAAVRTAVAVLQAVASDTTARRRARAGAAKALREHALTVPAGAPPPPVSSSRRNHHARPVVRVTRPVEDVERDLEVLRALNGRLQ